MEDIIISVLQRTLIAGTPLLLATIGEVICERSGILNLGVEGMMAIGAISAFIVTFNTGNPWLGLITAIIATALISGIHAFVSITLQSSQVVSGLALTMLGLGISGLVGKPYIGKPLAEKMAAWPIPLLSDIPVVGVIFFHHSPFFYMAIILALIAWFVLKYTRVGITIRSAGENPRATETQGISVSKIRYWCVMIGGALSGMADGRPRLDRDCPDHLCPLESPAGYHGCLFVRRHICAAVSAPAPGHLPQFTGHAALYLHPAGTFHRRPA
ncbi:MAG: ABC transporter permease [Desulfobacterales bacterium]